ncbi:MAG: amino acid adenylation domain-containing protein, partial [Chloroflexota bacterium]
MLFHALSAPNSGVDIQHITMRLKEEIDQDRFVSAWQAVFKKYDILRSRFRWERVPEPVQIIDPDAKLPVEKHDWTALTEADREQAWANLIESDRRQGFDLRAAPVMRLYLVRCKEGLFYCLWSFNHIILDGRSFPLLLQEVFQTYDGERLPDVTAPPTWSYGEYAEFLDHYEHGKSDHFWKELLGDFERATPLGLLDSRVQKRVAEAGANQTVTIDRKTVDRLQAYADENRVTMNTLVQGAWAILQARYTGEKEVTYGTTRAGRYAYGLAREMLGLFINTVPVSLEVDLNLALDSLLQRLREQHVAVRPHEITPINHIQKVLGLDGQTPLFQSLVVFENYDLNSALQGHGGRWENRSFNYQGQTNFPLTLMAYHDGELIFRLEYDADMFREDTISRMLEHLVTLLTNMPESADQPIGQIQYLPQSEINYLLDTLNPDFSDKGLDQTVYGLFAAQAEAMPDAIAISFEGETITYRYLAARVNRLANFLRKAGVKEGTLVGLCTERSIDMAVGLLGIMTAGGGYVPLDPTFPRERIAYMIEDSGMSLIVTNSGLLEILPTSDYTGKVVLFDQDREALAGESTTPLKPTARLEDVAYVIYTSGSTGKPKGVKVPHRSLTNFLLTMKEAPGMTADDVLAAVTTISFDIAALELFLPLISGAEVALVSDAKTGDGQALGDLLQASGATIMQATPATWRLLIESGWTGQSGLKILSGGEPLPRHLADKLLSLGGELWNMYGPTETTIWSTIAQIKADERPIDIGRPIANTSIYIIDDQRQLVARGGIGELCIGGQGVTQGYINRERLTAEKFIEVPFAEELIYRTGDLARYNHDGSIVCLGRIDHQLKIRGFRMEPGEIEAVLAQHSMVHEAVVIGRALDQVGGEKQLVAYVVPEADKVLNISDLRKFTQTKLPDYMVPSAFVTLDAFPLTANGKINRRGLPAPDGERPELDNPFVPPKTTIEKAIARHWREILLVNEIGVHDSFFDLGGDSLLVVRLLTRLRDEFGAELAVHELFANRTIRMLADRLDPDGTTAQTQDPISGQRHGRQPLGESQAASSDIAVIGMAGRFPKAANLDQFWENLANGVEGLRLLSDDELKDVEPDY